MSFKSLVMGPWACEVNEFFENYQAFSYVTLELRQTIRQMRYAIFLEARLIYGSNI